MYREYRAVVRAKAAEAKAAAVEESIEPTSSKPNSTSTSNAQVSSIEDSIGDASTYEGQPKGPFFFLSASQIYVN